MLRTIINVLPEKQKEVLQTLLSLIEPPETKTGCLSYGIFSDIEDENVFNLISEWETREHLHAFLTSERFRVLLGTKSLLCEPLSLEFLKVVDFGEIETKNLRRKKKVVPQRDRLSDR